MKKLLYFDCFSGISGDMALGALLDAGLPLDELRTALQTLPIDGWSLDAERGMRRYLAGTRALVVAPELETHRHLEDVRAIIMAAALPDRVRKRSIHTFELLAQAEGQVHGIAPEAVHFHEVGALDAIVDIVGVMAGLDLLGIDECYASALPLGTGWVRAAHGRLPVPAPATLNLLASVGAPILPDETRNELVTPTGAALLAALATFQRPAMRVERVGYGLGARELEHPNALRIWIGTTDVAGDRTTATQRTAAPLAHPSAVPPVLLETNIDDQPAEQVAYACEQLLALGALDAWVTPIQMKKGRVGMLLAALVPGPLEDAAVALIMHETTTLGIRRRVVERHVAERTFIEVQTPLGVVRYKQKRWGGIELGGAPEYEECAALARRHNLPLREVFRMVQEALGDQGAGAEASTSSRLFTGHHPS